MTTKPLIKSERGKRQDAETEAMLFEGATLSQLSRLFTKDNRSTKAKLYGCQPCGTRAGNPIWAISDAARYLVEPIWPIEEYVKHMTHNDLPMMLRKEYWAGMRSRQIFEIAAGDLWATEKVQEHIIDILKTISMSLRLTADTVERETGITDAQREVIVRLIDDALANAHRDLKSKFSKERAVHVTTDTDQDGDL